jgi:glutathione S-transferase
MRLYVVPGCPFGHRAAISLREKKLDFELRFFEPGKRPPELEAAGPRAKSPTIFDGDTTVFDSQVVLEYLEDQYPEPRLLPRDAAGRAEARMFIARFNDEIAPKFGTLISEALFKKPRDDAKVAEAKQVFLAALPAWNDHLKDRMFAVGDALSLADITLYTFFPAGQKNAGVEIPAELTDLRAWYERMLARPTTPVPFPA